MEPTNRQGWGLSENTSVRGSYHPFHFVVRLRHDMHERLEKSAGGISDERDFALLDAFSTYLHETLHWWQHIGSTTGLLLSLSPPMQSHINYNHLKLVLERIGPQKPLKRLTQGLPGKYDSEIEKSLNQIVNNWHDLEFNRRILLNPLALSDVLQDPYFDSQGHSIIVGLANLLLMVGDTFDRDYECVPHPRNWEPAVLDLRNRRVDGYYSGSTVRTGELGALQIFEGQARFSQLQYLFLTTNGKLSWDHFKAKGMLSGVYVAAFEGFLRLTGWGWPATPISPEVLLFLLVCDLALNPSDGYPFDIRHFDSLIESVDPGIRFWWFCYQLGQRQILRDSVKICSPEEYLEVATVLCKSLSCETPVEISHELLKWRSRAPGFAGLSIQEISSDYSEDNLPLRVCFAKHLRFAEQRMKRPDFFCWPAMHFIERKGVEVDLQESLKLYHQHQPPFLVHPNGEIRPALFQGVPHEKIYQTFNNFYYWVLLYDLMSQWIIQDGPYDLNYTWMHPLYDAQFTKPWAGRGFTEHFGVALDDFAII